MFFRSHELSLKQTLCNGKRDEETFNFRLSLNMLLNH